MQSQDNAAAMSGIEPKTTKLSKLSVNVTEADLGDVDAVVEQHRPFVRRHAVHLAALRLGLRELRSNPQRLVEQLTHEQQRRSRSCQGERS
jgi:hypothetical protein